MAPLAPGSLVVVVGITGFIASHIGLQALKAGYRVRGTVRNPAKAEELRTAYEKEGLDLSGDKLTFVTLNDLLSEDQFSAAFAGADGVIHPALPEFTSEDFVNKIVISTEVPLRAAQKAGIKRFVLCGTIVSAVMAGLPTIPKGKVFTEKDWNEAGETAYLHVDEETKKSFSYLLIKYTAGKIIGEKKAWEFMKTQSPDFELTVVLPAMNWGPVLFGPPPTSMGWLASMMKGETTYLSLPPHYLIDVRDDARLHVVSLSAPEAAGKRLWAAAQPVGWNAVLAVLRKNFPTAPIPEDVPESDINPCPWRVDNALEEKLLGGWVEFEKCIVDAAKSIGY